MLSDKEILRLWQDECHICRAKLGQERHLKEAIVELEITPKHAAEYYTKHYVVCDSCEKQGLSV